ncbi:putative ankyrin repeat-containing domain-containing protein [Helianthus debilis subsp. tardiflorus]
MTDEQLKLQNKNGQTALDLAAIAGNVTIARILVTRCRDLLNIRGGNGHKLPLYSAALYGRYDMVNYLYGESEDLNDDFWNNEHCRWLLLKCLEADMYGKHYVVIYIFIYCFMTTSGLMSCPYER